jgi:hypothetical protein
LYFTVLYQFQSLKVMVKWNCWIRKLCSVFKNVALKNEHTLRR